MEERFGRSHPDMEAMHRGFRTDPCFMCRMVDGDILFPENIVYEDERFLVFLDGYPRAYGYTLVAPKEHREQVTGDFTMEEYIRLQKLIYRVTEAVRQEVGPRGCTSSPSGPTRASPTSTGTSCRCLRACPTRISKASGPVGAGACSRYHTRRWSLSPTASARDWGDVESDEHRRHNE
jgi:hypothetical protein